jgi:hypothetical protein
MKYLLITVPILLLSIFNTEVNKNQSENLQPSIQELCFWGQNFRDDLCFTYDFTLFYAEQCNKCFVHDIFSENNIYYVYDEYVYDFYDSYTVYDRFVEIFLFFCFITESQ